MIAFEKGGLFTLSYEHCGSFYLNSLLFCINSAVGVNSRTFDPSIASKEQQFSFNNLKSKQIKIKMYKLVGSINVLLTVNLATEKVYSK